MTTSNIQYRLYVDKNVTSKYPSVIFLTEQSSKHNSNLPKMFDCSQNFELFEMGEFTPLVLSTNPLITTKLMLFISSNIKHIFQNILHKFSGVIYVFDTMKNIIYNTKTLPHQISNVRNPVVVGPRDRLNFFCLTTEMGRYVWYRLFFSMLFHIDHTDASRRESLGYLNHQVARHKQESHPEIVDMIADPVNLYTMTCPIYPNVTSTLPSKDTNKLFALRYAICSLVSQLKYKNNKPYNVQSKTISFYRGAQSTVVGIQKLISSVGSLITKISFVCWCSNENEAKSFTIGDMKNPYKQPVMQKINVPINIKIPYGYLSNRSQTTDRGIRILRCLSLFRVDKVERTEQYWYIELTLIDEQDKQYRSLVSPWTQLIDEEYRSRSCIHQDYFRYLSVTDASFLRFQIFVDVVLRLGSNDFAWQDLLQFFRSRYHNNANGLHQIDLFEQTYQSEDAILWYTRVGFLSRVLHETLRKENDNTVMKLRFFIHDLHNQLAKLQINYLRSLPNDQPNIVVYRGQTMPIAELEHLRQHQGSLISMNSFLSTTVRYDVAVMFSGGGISEIEEGHVSVIFEISVDTRSPLTIPFARIDNQSLYQDEEEILFSMAAIFRIQNAEKIGDKFWHIKLMLERNMDNEQWLLLTSHLND